MNLSDVIISKDYTVRSALAFLDEKRSQFALVVDEGILLGVVTDGDIRRTILRGMGLETSILEVMNKNPKSLHNNHGLTKAEAIQLMNKIKVRNIPIVDQNNKLKSVLVLDELLANERLGITALILAGGRGERLKPLTDNIPKPLIRVGTRSLLERTILSMTSQNINKIYIATYYKKEKFAEFLGDGSKFGIEIEIIEEPEPMGTAGAISLIPNLDQVENLLVSNADLIHDIDYRYMLDFHIKSNSDCTVASVLYPIRVPYGVIREDSLRLIAIDEKPSFHFPVMCGVNILGRKTLDFFGQASKVDMVTTIKRAVTDNLSVNIYKSEGHWIDVGDAETLRKELSYFAEESES